MNGLQIKMCCWILPLVFFSNFQSTHNQSTILIEKETTRYSSHFPTAWATEISLLCHNDSLFYLQAYSNKEKWALNMYKSTGMLSLEGLLDNNMGIFTSSSGLFDECISIVAPPFQGQYCSVFFKIEEGMVRGKQRDGDGHTFKLPRTGFCIPSSCSSSDFRSSVSQLITRNTLIANVTSSIVTITDENYCYTKKKLEFSISKFDGPDIAVIIVLSLLGLSVLSATLYDGWRSLNGREIVDTKWGKLLLCFSALENGRKVLSTETTSSDMPCLHGIRFLSVTWIILFHVNLFMLNVSAMDSALGPDKHILNEWGMQALMRGAVSVDTFFLMSGLLTSYSLLRELKRSNGNFNVFSFYFHRFIRISPFYFLYLGFLATLLVHLGTGPLWQFVHQKSESCRVNFWKHFLYIDNYFDNSNPLAECMVQSWYLAVDMQLSILSPLFVYPLWRWRRVGLAWIIFAIVALIGAIGTIFIVWNIPCFFTADDEQNLLFLFYYFQTFGRAPQYLVGIILGWILVNGGINQERQRNLVGIIFGWILSMATIFICIYGLIPFLDEELEVVMNSFTRVTYGTLSRIGWALAVGWVIFACLNGYGGFANRILSWEGFMPLGRLSLVAYVVHYDFIKIYYINKAPLYFTKMDVMMNYFLVLMVSYMLAFILSICIEMPFINLDRYLMSTTINEGSERNQENTNKE